MTVLKHKGYEGSAEIDVERGVCHGRIRLIDDLVTYEAANPKDLVKEFEAAVDDYFETCKKLGRAPKRSYGGVFNVRTTPDKHCALALYAARRGMTLNAAVNEGVDILLKQEKIRSDSASQQILPEVKLLVSGTLHSSRIQWDVEEKLKAKPIFAKATAPGEDFLIEVAASVH